MDEIVCPNCGGKTTIEETKFDAWGYPYSYKECDECDAHLTYNGDVVRIKSY